MQRAATDDEHVPAPRCTVRQARPEDEPALAAIDVATWSPDVTPAPEPDPGSGFFGDPARRDEILVADLDGTVVGYVALHQAIRLESHRHVLEITGLAVAPTHHGRGVGRLLLAAATRAARGHGARKVSLRVLAPNTAARRLYESCGFEVEGVLKEEFRLDGRYVDDLLMAFRIEDPGL